MTKYALILAAVAVVSFVTARRTYFAGFLRLPS